MLRYAVGLLPNSGIFPVWTLFVNALGALIIGMLVGLSASKGMSREWELFLKPGLCGGFTTFSAFSLESYELFKAGFSGQGLLYIGLSLGLSLLGVACGIALGEKIL